MIKFIKQIWERIGGKAQQPQVIAVVEPGPKIKEKKPRKPRTRKTQ